VTEPNSPPCAHGEPKSRPPRICIITADHSGDAIGARLIDALRRREGDLVLVGAGGPAMEETGLKLLSKTTRWAVLGVGGWIRVLIPAMLDVWRLRLVIRLFKADLLVCIDSGGFNVPIARALRWCGGQKVLYYIPPRCWSRKWNVRKLREADYVAAPFPWNVEGDDGSGRVRFVGHPAADLAGLLPPKEEARQQLGLASDRPTIALLPGSRKLELRANLPPLLQAVKRLREEMPELQVVLSRARNVKPEFIKRFLNEEGVDWVAMEQGAWLPLRSADMAFVCMGTATLEACALDVPMVAVYRGTWVGRLEFKFRSPETQFFALPNIFAGKRIALELLERDVNPERLADEARTLLTDPQAAAEARERLRSVASMLGGQGAADRAAQAVMDALDGNWHRTGGTVPVDIGR